MAITVAMRTEISQLYVALFGRAPDAEGLGFWVQLRDQGQSLTQIANTMYATTPARAYYPSFLTNQEIIASFYLNVLGRTADAEGLAFWTAKLNAAGATPGSVITQMIGVVANYTGTDPAGITSAALFNNKVEVAQYYGEHLGTIAGATAAIAGVTADDASVTAAIAAINGAAVVGQTFTLTPGVDNVVGTAGNDTFVGVTNGFTDLTSTYVETFGGLDSVDGGNGNDTLIITNPSDTGTLTLGAAVTVKNVESLSLISAGNTVTADVQSWAGLQNVSIDERNDEDVYVDTKSNVTNVSIKGGYDVYLTDNGAATEDVLSTVSIEGTSDYVEINSDAAKAVSITDSDAWVTVDAASGPRALNINVNNATYGLDDSTATSVAITATGEASTFELDTDVATTVTVGGDAKLSLSMWDFTSGWGTASVSSITSTNTAGVNITTALNNTTAFTGGSGKDTVTISNANTKAVAMGAGDDKVNVSGTTLGTGGTVDGGDGTDTIAMSAADAAALSATATYEARISNFEKVGLGQVAALTSSTVNLANVDDISYVVSAGTAAGAGAAEVAAVTFNSVLEGQSVTVGGQTINFGGNLTAAQVASAVSALINVPGYTDSVSGSTVTFTATAPGNQTNLTASVGLATAPTLPGVATSQGVAPVPAVTETGTVTFSAIAIGQTLTIDGITVTATGGAASAIDIATAFRTGVTSGNAVVSGADAGGWSGAAGATLEQVVFTSATANSNVGDLAITGTAAIPAVTEVQGNAGSAGSTETATVTFTDLMSGQSVTVAGRTVTAVNAHLTAAQVADAFFGGVNAGAAAISGTLSGWTVANAVPADSALEFTSTTATANVADITRSVANSPASVAPSVVVTDGDLTSGGGALTLTNMANGGTLELTGANLGATTVVMKDATGTADSFNLKLNGTANLAAGAVNVAGVETIYVVATDSSADTPTITNPTAPSTLQLNAGDATSVTLSGNHGVNFTGSSLAKVTNFDASGVAGNVDPTGKTAAQILADNSAAGAVTFVSQNATDAVTIKGGSGNDWLEAAASTKVATISGGAGNDTIIGKGGKDVLSGAEGNDIIVGNAAADSLSGGAGNDIFKFNATTDSTVSAMDVISDFSANTFGNSTTPANVTGAGTQTSWTGDVLVFDVDTAVLTGGTKVFVAANAADAQTFIQNTAESTADVFIAALDASTGALYADWDSDGTIDSVVSLTGVTTITAAAFALV